nr:hypothetical protein [candidate division Zixibacteria bacterium]
MKKPILPLYILLALLITGCSSDDNGTDGDGDEPTIVRLVVDSEATKPTLGNVNEAVWFTIDSMKVEIGGSSTYGINPNLGKQDVTLRAIEASDTLYLWARWHDATANIWGGYIVKSSLEHEWDSATYTYDDQFFVLLDAGGDGVETGKMDVWNWMSSRTAPGFLAQDESWNGTVHTLDTVQPNINPYRRNWSNLMQKPFWMHRDTLDYTGSVLYLEDTVEMNVFLNWPAGYKLPGYAIDSTIHSSATRGESSRWDVVAISKYDSTGLDASDYTWTVVFARAMNTGRGDDVSLTSLDSIEVRIEATHNGSDSHSGSAPFWIIF